MDYGSTPQGINRDRVTVMSGFPQGCPFSPILSSYAISQSLMKVFPNCLLYADDGLLFSYSPEEVEKGFKHRLLRDFGIFRNESKSR